MANLHIIKLLYGDKSNPTRELSLSDIDGSIYIEENGFAPGAGQQNVLYTGTSTRYDGQQRVSSTRDNIRLAIRYGIAGDNRAHLSVIQRKISRFFLEAQQNHEGPGERGKVWLQYRWTDGSDLGDLPRPVWGQTDYYLEIINAEGPSWPDELHRQMVGGYVHGILLNITGGPYWEGLEQQALNADGLADANDSALSIILNNSEITDDWAIAGWIEHRASDYEVLEYYEDASNYVRLYWDQSDGRFEIERNVAGTPTTTNGGSQSLSAGTLYHLALIQDSTGSTLKSYLGGAEDISTTDNTQTTGGTLTIGSATSVATTANSTGVRAWRIFDGDFTTTHLSALYTAEAAIITAGDALGYVPYMQTLDGDGTIYNINGAANIFTVSGAIAHWPLDESSGNRVDIINSYALTENSSAGYSATGKVDGAVDLEASSSEALLYSSDSPFDFANTDFSITCWINKESHPGNHVILARWTTSLNWRSYQIYTDSSNVYFEISSDGTAGTVTTVSQAAASTGTWYFVAVYHDATNDEIGISINNAAFTTASHSGGSYSSTAYLNVGDDGTGSPYFDGLIDELSFFDTVITTDEVSTLYNSGNGVTFSADEYVDTENYAPLYTPNGDTLNNIRFEIEPPPSNTSRVYRAGILPVTSSYTPENVHYIDFNATSDDTGFSGNGYTSASATSGTGSDSATIEAAITTPGDLKPGAYRVLARTKVAAGSATTATVTPYYRIGETTSPEVYGDDTSIASGSNFLLQDLGQLEIGWPMGTLVKMTFGIKYAETEATAITASLDFIMLLPEPVAKVECEDSTITVASGDTLHIAGRRSWMTDNSNSDSQLYHFHFTGEELAARPYLYNYLFLVQGEDGQQYYIDNEATVRAYVTPRYSLPGGLIV